MSSMIAGHVSQMVMSPGFASIQSIILAQNYKRDPFYDEDDRDDIYSPSPRQQPYRKRKPISPGSGQLFRNQKQIGAALIGGGFLLTFLGILLFFEGNLLRLGNICMILGIPLLVGIDRIRSYFLQSSRMQATIILAIGILLVFIGKPRLGIICEIFGLLNLFGNMFPVLLAMGRSLPIIGDIIRAFEGDRNTARGGREREKERSKRYQPEF
mmetsp:Transcript_33912/g.34544  ORF Transcript_33912/g.34544 Transcript_33912/m.34544 type:complete len:212 (+) Transcript_33912:175-810(+)